MKAGEDQPAFDSEKLRHDLVRAFPLIVNPQIDHILSIVNQVKLQRHGTLLLVGDHAQQEAQRLMGMQAPVKPFSLTVDLLTNVSAIDGAVLLAPDGICYGIGIILDGKASAKTTPGRGSRYNSAIRYIDSSESQGMTWLAVIVSEDGTIDLYPNWPVAIERSEVDNLIRELKALATLPDISLKKFLGLMDRLERLRFYLCDNDADVINPLVWSVAERLKDSPGWYSFFLRKEFTVDREFNKGRFYL